MGSGKCREHKGPSCSTRTTTANPQIQSNGPEPSPGNLFFDRLRSKPADKSLLVQLKEPQSTLIGGFTRARPLTIKRECWRFLLPSVHSKTCASQQRQTSSSFSKAKKKQVHHT